MSNVRCGPPLAALLIAGALGIPAFAQDPIKIGVLEDQSGDFAAATMGKVHGIELATDEINAAGGIAGRPIELVVYDTQSDNMRYQEFMRRVLQRDKVDVVFAGFSSRLARGLPADRRTSSTASPSTTTSTKAASATPT